MRDHHSDHDHTAATPKSVRYGLILFFTYVLLYGAFVYLSAFRPDVMRWRPFGGVNLAVLYGLGLIVAAIVLALIYMVITRARADDGGGEGRP